jgi:hypothetical protein
MSSADISVFTNLLLVKDQLLAGLAETKENLRDWGNDVGANPIMIGFNADLTTLQAAIDGFRDAQEAEPIVIPIILDAQNAMNAVAMLRNTLSEGGMNIGGSGGVASVAANVGAASAVQAVSSGSGEAAYGALFAGPGNFGSPPGDQGQFKFGPDAPDTGLTNWGPGKEYMQAMEQAQYGPADEFSGLGSADFAADGGAGSSYGSLGSPMDSGTSGGGGRGGGMMGMRKIFMGVLAARAGVADAEAGGNLLGEIADYKSNPQGAEAFRRAGEKDIQEIPILGKTISEVGEMPNRLLSALDNWSYGSTRKGGYGNNFESDLAYGERVEKEATAEDRDTKEMHREAGRRLHKEESLYAESAHNRYETGMEGMGAGGRADYMQKHGMEDIDAEFKGDQYHMKAGGPLTAAAAELRQTKIDRLNTDISEDKKKEAMSIERVQDEDAAPARNDKERMDEYRRKLDLKQDTLGLAGDSQAVEQLRKDRPRLEKEEQDKLNRESGLSNAESADRVSDIGAQAAEATIRSKGELYEADTLAFNQSQEDQLKKLHERYDAETDEAKKANIAKEITATEAAQVVEKEAREVAHKAADVSSSQEINQRTRQAQYGAAGDSYDAKLSAINFQEAQAYGDFSKKSDSQSAQAAARYGTAQRAELNMSENEKYDSLKISGEEDIARAAGRGGEADVLALRERVSKLQKDAGGDPTKLAQVDAYAHAQAAAMRKELTDAGPAVYGLSGEEADKYFQQQADRGAGNQAAMKALNRFEGDVNQRGVLGKDSIDSDDRGFGVDMKNAGKDLAAAAKKLADLPKIYVVGAGANQ